MGRNMLGWSVLAMLATALPWLNPLAPGPSPALMPWLIALAAAASLLLVPLRAPANPATAVSSFSGHRVRPTAWGWLLAGLLSSAIGLLQYFGAAAFFGSWVSQTMFGEAFANLRQRNQFASLTNIALVTLLWLAVQVRQPPLAVSYWRFYLLFIAAALLAVGNAISSSRTGLFQLLLLCSLYAVWGGLRDRAIQRLLLCAALVYAIAMFAMPWMAGLDVSTHGAFARIGKDEVCASRLTLWSNVLHLIAQKPWLGWGWGELDYAHFITLYNEPRFCDILDNAHNLPLHLAVELGVPFALLVCGGFTWWALRQKPWAERDATRQMAWAVLALILLHSMLEYPLWYGPFQMAFAACVWILWRQKPPFANRNDSKIALNRAAAQVLQAQAAISSVAIIALISIAYAMWDYHRISQIYLAPEARDAQYRDNTLAKISDSWLFADQVRFAELVITPLSPANAAGTFNTAKKLLHYSPEPRVIEKLIESAVMLGRDDEALAYLARYRAAFPKQHALWAKANAKPDAKPD